MKASLFLEIVAAYLVLIGTASLAIPQAAASSLGPELTSLDVFAARTVGMIDWWSSNLPAALLGGLICANPVMNAALAILDTLSLLSGTI